MKNKRSGSSSLKKFCWFCLTHLDSVPPAAVALSTMMAALRLDGERRAELAQHGSGAQNPQSGPATQADLWKVRSSLVLLNTK